LLICCAVCSDLLDDGFLSAQSDRRLGRLHGSRVPDMDLLPEKKDTFTAGLAPFRKS